MPCSINVMDKINLLGLNRAGLAHCLCELGVRPSRAGEVLQGIHQQGITDIAQLVNLNKTLRLQLKQVATIGLPKIVACQQSQDGTIKWLLKLQCGNCIETVFIPEAKRGTVCVSSQVGCGLNCSFCVTGKQGFNRNLSAAEIIAQVWVVKQQLSQFNKQLSRCITNVVMMGMGEPLLNFKNVVAAMAIMLDDCGYGLAKQRVTLSTAGLVPMMEKLKQVSPVALAVSLHAPDDALRNQLVPLNRKYPLKLLMAGCKNYFNDEPRRRVTFEYLTLKGINDEPEHVQALIKLLQGIPAKVNLIPFNVSPTIPYQCSSQSKIQWFCDQLMAHGIMTTVRKTRGFDINAACGLLAGNFKDRTARFRRSIRQS